ncbi:unnamed protein product [Clonostachys rhizophaga]|uniref:Amidohydrolase-related domain-containing protein n=1 Tax=Clonostachys rhizophaga TaxID=160324 RepID=A0A9N9VTI6_9HYPO|nr:unnamed protein product [Clonostachys rhizophaga]
MKSNLLDGRPPNWQKRPRTLASMLRIIEKNFLLCCTVAALTTYLLVSHNWHGISSKKRTHQGHFTLPPEDLDYGLQQCALNQVRPIVNWDSAATRLAKARSGPRTILIHATLIDGDEQVSPGCTIEMQDGIIVGLSTVASLAETANNLHGRIVTPGLVDMHSHIGIRETPQLWATEDVTESSSPVTPWGRAVDAIKASDQAFPVVASGGVTTSLVLTGAKNSISGEGAVLKMKRGDSVSDLLVNLTEFGGKPQRYLKMAMGENQKRQFQKVPGGPVSRLGESYVYRKAYDNARRVKQSQDMWCEMATAKAGRARLATEYPRSLEWQTLVDVLRGDVRVNIHGYETEDILAMFDHSDEFGFNIIALHHGLHADSVADEVKRRNVAVVGFTDSWGDKWENYNVSLYFPKRIADHGIPLAFTRDHPALHGQFLIYEAQIAHHFGVDAKLALSSVMSVPANLIGLHNRHRLRVGASPLQVFIEGQSVVRAASDVWHRSREHPTDAPPSRPESETDKSTNNPVGQENLVLTGLTNSFIGVDNKRSQELKGSNMTAIIQKGRVTCVGGEDCANMAEKAAADGVTVVHVDNAFMLPGLTVATRQHGLAEMALEPSTTDGSSPGDNFDNPPETTFGLTLGGIHLQSAYHAGVTRIITPPLTTGFFHGISARFRAGATSVLDDGAISDPNVALHFTIGHDAKGRISFSSIPIVVHTNNKDVIAHIIALKRETHAHIVIMGGAEAHLLATELSEVDVPVIVAPFWGCEPLFWDSRHCLPGPPLTDNLGPQVLIEAGVTVGIGSWDNMNNHIQSSIWEASWLAGPANHSLALDLVTTNVEKALKLSEARDVVVYEGIPFEFGARVALSLEEGIIRSFFPSADATE